MATDTREVTSQIELYKQIIKLDPANAEAMYYLAGLYLEFEPLDKDKFDANRVKARKYYKGAAALGHTNAEVDLRHLTLDMLKHLAKKHEDDGEDYCCEKGQDSGIIDLKNAVMMYKQAMNTYDELISILDGIDLHSNMSEKDKKMIGFEKNSAETNKLILKSKILLLEKNIKKKQDIKSKESIRFLCKSAIFLHHRVGGSDSPSSDGSDSSDDSDNDEHARSPKENTP